MPRATLESEGVTFTVDVSDAAVEDKLFFRIIARGQRFEDYVLVPEDQQRKCPDCRHAMHGYRGPLCRSCDPKASTE